MYESFGWFCKTGRSYKHWGREKEYCSGYSCGSYGADGDFGNGTYNAVVKFQKNHYLSADGIVGKNTWRKLLCL